MTRPRALLRPWPQLRHYSTGQQRELFRRVAQPVAVLTAHLPPRSLDPTGPAPTPATDAHGDDVREHNHGATLSSLTSISLSPPLVSFSLRLPSRLATHLASTPRPRFRVHLLSPREEDLARVFARQAPLPDSAAPSPSATTTQTDWSTEPAFDASVFRRLADDSNANATAAGLGSIECTVVHTVDLWRIDDADRTTTDRTDDADNRSQLFVARVESVKLGDRGESAGAGSLVWMEQQYRAIDSKEGASH
ncbi:hypothetical protein JCM11491_006654 [Sporobolomyces phaffii]